MINQSNISNEDAIRNLVNRTKPEKVSSDFTLLLMQRIEKQEKAVSQKSVLFKLGWLTIAAGCLGLLLFLPVWSWAGIHTSLASICLDYILIYSQKLLISLGSIAKGIRYVDSFFYIIPALIGFLLLVIFDQIIHNRHQTQVDG